MDRIRCAFLLEGTLTELTSRMGSGALLVGYALSLGAQAPYTGLLSTARFARGIGQLGVGTVVGKLHSRRKFCLLGMGFAWWARLAIALLPFLLYAGVKRDALFWSCTWPSTWPGPGGGGAHLLIGGGPPLRGAGGPLFSQIAGGLCIPDFLWASSIS
ncbi:MAG TPA: hypothetical protein EYP17_04920 [Candidatus Latescibacteria bacterium]|nr:hypothetical protein [Candidatus Latescibacterota bacterium]